MKVLIDECVPWPLHKLLTGHACHTAQQKGWGGMKNGDLLKQAEGVFEVFLTADQNLRYQQTSRVEKSRSSNSPRMTCAACKQPPR